MEKFIEIKKGGEGFGMKASMWFDNWSNIGALHTLVSCRDMYNARRSVDMKVGEFMENGVWPQEWVVKFPMITQLQPIVLDPLKNDYLVWRCKDGQLRNFSVRQAYSDLLSLGNKVPWFKLI